MTGIQETQAAVVAPYPTCPDLAYEREGMIEVKGGKVWYGIYGIGACLCRYSAKRAAQPIT